MLMRFLRGMAALALVLFSIAAAPGLVRAAQEPSEDEGTSKQWVWLARQGVWGYGERIQEGPQRGLWNIDPGTKVAAATPDRYGSAELLNRLRPRMGRAPGVHDPDL